MADFDDFRDAVAEGARELGRDLLDGLEDEARADAEAFLTRTEADLRRWTKLLAAGELSEQDFADLVAAKKALAEIHALGRAGLAHARLERFRTRLVNLVIDAAFDTFV